MIDKHKNDDKNLLNELKKFYFLGAKNANEAMKIDTLITTESSLQEYTISKRPYDINEDPTRRYYETHLAYETLKSNPVREIDLDELKTHYLCLVQMLPTANTDGVTKQLMEEIFSENFTNVKKDLLNAKEYHDAIKRLESKEHYKEFSAGDKEKMALIVKCSFLCISVPNESLPIDIYNEGYYLSHNRGKAVKNETEQLNVTSPHYGLMKSYMPVPPGDIATSDQAFPYLRVADRHNFNPESKWALDNFSRLVHPFSCSISGTMLLHQRVFKQLENQGQFVFRDKAKFACFLKTFIPLMVYNCGGHSFHEFMYPLSLPAICENFTFIPGFTDMNLENLFMNGNE